MDVTKQVRYSGLKECGITDPTVANMGKEKSHLRNGKTKAPKVEWAPQPRI